MPKHARPPLEVVPSPADAESLAKMARKRATRRIPARDLPDDDPFVLIDMVDATGGVRGDTKPMSPTAAAAFRLYCSMPPTHRSLTRLATTLEKEWGKAPNRKTIEKWSAQHKWTELLKSYDSILARYRLWREEQDRAEMNDRQARLGRTVTMIAAKQLELDLKAMRDAAEHPAQPQINPRTGRPMAPTKVPNRIQGLSFMLKTGMEAERIALGAPTVVTQGNVTADIHATQANVTMSLDEWRRASRVTGDAGDEDGRRLPTRDETRALPAPTSKPWLVGVTEEEAQDLPSEWFEEDAPADAPERAMSHAPTLSPTRGQIVDADPPVDPLNASGDGVDEDIDDESAIDDADDEGEETT